MMMQVESTLAIFIHIKTLKAIKLVNLPQDLRNYKLSTQKIKNFKVNGLVERKRNQNIY